MARSKARHKCMPRLGGAVVQKQMLLPLPAAHINEISLKAHMALAACRTGNGNRYQLFELVRCTYLSYFLWKEGCGSAEHALYCAVESVLEASAEAAEKTGDWLLSTEAATLVEVVLQTFDDQISSVNGKAYIKCRAKLDHLMRVDIPRQFESAPTCELP